MNFISHTDSRIKRLINYFSIIKSASKKPPLCMFHRMLQEMWVHMCQVFGGKFVACPRLHTSLMKHSVNFSTANQNDYSNSSR
jgi:hypothetical protein